MNKLLKKTLSVMLVIIMVVSAMPMAFAAGDKQQVAHDGDPIVVVRGIDFAGLVDEKTGKKAINLEAVDITNLIFNFGINYIKKDKNAVVNTITSLGCDIFKNVKLDKEGNPANPNVSIPKFPESADNYELSDDSVWADTAVGLYRSIARNYGGTNTYLYTFDWRLSPKELADDLKSYLEGVMNDNPGATKVDIAACSMGGMVTTAYIKYHGTDILDSVFFLSGAHNGGHIVGSAFRGDLVIDNDGITNFLIEKTSGNFGVNLLVRMICGLGILKGVVKFLNEVLVEYKEQIYGDFLRECLATAYGLWGMVPDEEFDAAVDFFFDGVEDEYAVALERINGEVREFVCSTEKTMAKLEAAGVKFGYVSHYNSRQLPIYSGFRAHGDGVLESDRTSGGAKFAEFGKTLTTAELAGVAEEYISPDKVVDASGCLYVDRTWIVKNAKHVGCKDGSEHTEFAYWLITQETQPTVYTTAKYPRFMNCDANENFIGF